MKQEMKHFGRINLNLNLIVDDLRMRQEGQTSDLQELKNELNKQEKYKKMFRDDVYDTLQHALDKKKLKPAVIRLYKKYVKEEFKEDGGDADVQAQHQKERKHLETNVSTLQENMSKRQKQHKKENQKIMKENVDLLKQIND